jgi:hypothetical protein
MFSDGRYIYIISQWAKETGGNDSSQNEGEDEEEAEENVKVEKKAARYGVDIYDPINNFDHVKGVELVYSDSRKKALKNADRKKVYSPINLAVIK